jgi:leucyl aminopeptidase
VTALTLSTAAVPGLRADAIVIGVAKGAASKSAGLVVAPGAEAVDKADSPASWRPSARPVPRAR